MVTFWALGSFTSSVLGVYLEAVKAILLDAFSVDIFEAIFAYYLEALSVFEDIRVVTLGLDALESISVQLGVLGAGVEHAFIILFLVTFRAVFDAQISLFGEASITV